MIEFNGSGNAVGELYRGPQLRNTMGCEGVEITTVPLYIAVAVDFGGYFREAAVHSVGRSSCFAVPEGGLTSK